MKPGGTGPIAGPGAYGPPISLIGGDGGYIGGGSSNVYGPRGLISGGDDYITNEGTGV